MSPAAPAPQAPGLTPELASQLIAIDPQQGSQIVQAFRQMDTARMEQAERTNGLLARTGQYLLGIPEAERAAELQRITPQLIQQGIPQEQIAGFVPTTANIQLAIAQARDIEKLIEDARPRLMNVDGQVIDQNRLTAPVRPGSPVMFESELIPTQNGVYRRSDLTGGDGGQAPVPPQVGEVRQTSRGPMRFRGGNVNDPNNYEPVQGGPSREDSGTFRGRPVADGGTVIRSLFPSARITEVRRPSASRLGRANPGSWHVRSGGAVDVAPIPGMNFSQYVQRIRDAGYRIIEQRDEVTNPSAHATGPHWHVVIGAAR